MDKSKESPSSSERGTHLLVIRLSALGDVAMTVPVLRTFAQQYPQVKVTVLSKPFFKPLFAGIPNLFFYEADVKGKHKGLPGLWKLAGELQELRISAVADLHNVLRSNVLKLFFGLKRIPVVRIDKGRKAKKALTRKKNKHFEPLKTTPRRYADVFEKLGFPIDLSQHRFPSRKNLNPTVARAIGSDGKKWIGIAPFAAYKGKTYPPDLMKELLGKLHATGRYKILLFGGGRKEAKTLKTFAESYENAVNAAGVFTFEQELSLIANLDAMVAMDSGNAHLAAMYGIKTITLWGVTHPYAGFGPFGQPKSNALLSDREKYPLIPTSVYGNSYPKDYEDAMRSISPEAVFKKITEIIEMP